MNTYRLATTNDRNSIMKGMIDIMEIEERVFTSEAHKNREWDAIDNGIKNQAIILAENSNLKTIGFIWYVISNKCFYGVDYVPYDTNYMWISYIWVDSSYRGQGIAKGLYNNVIAICHINTIKKIWLDVNTKNMKSIMFHESIGFTPQISLYSLNVDDIKNNVNYSTSVSTSVSTSKVAHTEIKIVNELTTVLT